MLARSTWREPCAPLSAIRAGGRWPGGSPSLEVPLLWTTGWRRQPRPPISEAGGRFPAQPRPHCGLLCGLLCGLHALPALPAPTKASAPPRRGSGVESTQHIPRPSVIRRCQAPAKLALRPAASASSHPVPRPVKRRSQLPALSEVQARNPRHFCSIPCLSDRREVRTGRTEPPRHPWARDRDGDEEIHSSRAPSEVVYPSGRAKQSETWSPPTAEDVAECNGVCESSDNAFFAAPPRGDPRPRSVFVAQKSSI